jgi:hypothetical protein
MSRLILATAILIGVAVLTSPAVAQLDFSTGGTGTTTTGGTTTGGGGGGAAGGLDQSLLGDTIQGQLFQEAASGAGQISGTERFYREATTAALVSTNPSDRSYFRFMGPDSYDMKLFVGSVGTTGTLGTGTYGSATTQAASYGGSATGGGAGGARTGAQSSGLSLGTSRGGTTGGFAQGGGFGGGTGLGGIGGLGGVGTGGLFGGGGGVGGVGQTGLQTGGVGTTQQQTVRAQMVLGFTPQVMVAPQIHIQLGQRLATAVRLPSPSQLQVELAGRTAVLRGTVHSEHSRSLAERLAMLEPGVSAVRNELTVAPAPLSGGSGLEE